MPLPTEKGRCREQEVMIDLLDSSPVAVPPLVAMQMPANTICVCVASNFGSVNINGPIWISSEPPPGDGYPLGQCFPKKVLGRCFPQQSFGRCFPKQGFGRCFPKLGGVVWVSGAATD